MSKLNSVADSAIKAYRKVFRLPSPPGDDESLLMCIQSSSSKILSAESLFNEITDDDLIDYATYDILAEKARYSYLIKKAKEKNLHA
ncbi:DUF2508 family protein [Clostridium aminobutyricum]|uniref:DUF2508 family protein n=1 Tax=Clostridium aminobutyricum TaxID=33953 RepID=A0A939DAU9_CLOAM|nr:DUF2508 family protein [Clostridium aminobutyricum]MBN7773883.1 DUF2508 family protein [Clostridium aminobutyricum]